MKEVSRRTLLGEALALAIISACKTAEADPNLKRVEIARRMQIASGETMIPMPDLGEIKTTQTSFGTDRIEVYFDPKLHDGLYIPSLAQGKIWANVSNLGNRLSRVKVEMGGRFWIFEAPGQTFVPKRVGEITLLGEPMFRLDFSKFNKEAYERYEEPVMFIRASESPNEADEKFSKIGVANILKDVNGEPIRIPVLF